MSDQSTLRDLTHEACKLAAMLEGLDVLIHEAEGGFENPTSKMAGNSLPPMVETVIQKAWALTTALEKLETAERRQK